MKDEHTYGEKMAKNGRNKVIYKGTFVSIQTLPCVGMIIFYLHLWRIAQYIIEMNRAIEKKQLLKNHEIRYIKLNDFLS